MIVIPAGGRNPCFLYIPLDSHFRRMTKTNYIFKIGGSNNMNIIASIKQVPASDAVIKITQDEKAVDLTGEMEKDQYKAVCCKSL